MRWRGRARFNCRPLPSALSLIVALIRVCLRRALAAGHKSASSRAKRRTELQYPESGSQIAAAAAPWPLIIGTLVQRGYFKQKEGGGNRSGGVPGGKWSQRDHFAPIHRLPMLDSLGSAAMMVIS